jgi:hypothetical protein
MGKLSSVYKIPVGETEVFLEDLDVDGRKMLKYRLKK